MPYGKFCGLLCLALFSILLMSEPAFAQANTYTWIGGTLTNGADWFNPANWICTGVACPVPPSVPGIDPGANAVVAITTPLQVVNEVFFDQPAFLTLNQFTFASPMEMGTDSSSTLQIIGNSSNDGLLAIGGTLNNGSRSAAPTFNNNGELDGGMLNNYGTLNNSGFMNNHKLENIGTFNNSGGLLNEGTIDNSGTFFHASSYFHNYGTINNTGTFMDFSTSLQNFGVINNNGGRFQISGKVLEDGTYTQTAGFTQLNGVLSSSMINVQGGTFLGVGSINGNFNLTGGSVQASIVVGDPPGIFPGTLTVFGNYEQVGTGSLNELMSPFSQGLLHVTGDVALGSDSSLQIMLLDGFNPLGQTFSIMDYTSLVGEFSNGSSFFDDGFLWDITYGQHEIDVTAVGTPEPSALLLLGFGLVLLAGYVARK